MQEIPPPWGEYARLQALSARISTVDSTSWGIEEEMDSFLEILQPLRQRMSAAGNVYVKPLRDESGQELSFAKCTKRNSNLMLIVLSRSLKREKQFGSSKPKQQQPSRCLLSS